MQTRKQFIKNSLSFATSSALLGFNGVENLFASSTDPEYLTFDLHAHPGKLFAQGSADFGEIVDPNKTLSDMNGARLSGAFFALVADSKLIKVGKNGVLETGKYKPGEAWTEYKRQLKDLQAFFQSASVRQATLASELKKKMPMAAYIAVEGGDFLEGQVKKLEEAYHDGVRSVQLVHYTPNDLGDLQTSASTHNGLSAFGMEVVRKMNELGMLIDVAHASYQTTRHVASLSYAPIMLSHSILEMDTDRPVAKRAISKEHAKLVAQTGGLIGAWPSGFNKNFEEFVDNTLRLIDVVGINHVGIGTDMDANFKPVLDNYSQYPTFAEALKTKGLSKPEVAKVMGGNAARLLKKVMKHL